MIYLQIDELKTHFSTALVDAISGNDDVIPQAAIDAAIAEAKGYLTKYDIPIIFNPVALTDRNPILLLYIKDVAAWHYIQLANPNIDLQFRERRYELARQWFKDVQSGKTVPELPIKAQVTSPSNQQVIYGSSRKQSSGFL
jgi:phage gp36-like protein